MEDPWQSEYVMASLITVYIDFVKCLFLSC